MSENRTANWRLLTVLGGVLVAGLAAAFWPESCLQMGRLRSVRHQIERTLEDWGVIPVDLFRHIQD